MTEAPSGEAELVQRWSEQARVPSWLTKVFEKWATEREYIHTTAMAEDQPSKVAVNYLYRAVISKLALLQPENPQPVVKRTQYVEPGADDPRADQWRQFMAFQDRVAQSAACVLKRWATEEHLGGLTERAVLEALVSGVIWIKSGFMEDAGRDPIGRSVRHAGARGNLLTLRRLSAEYEAGEWGQDDYRYAEMMALTEFARDMARAANPMPGDPRGALAELPDGMPAPSHLVPEPKVWRGGTVSLVDPENIRFDTQRVTAPEFLHLGRFIQERSWMTRDEAAEQFHLSDEEKKSLGSPWRDIRTDQPSLKTAASDSDPADTELEDDTRDGGREVAVWERHDMELGQVCWWVQGIPRVLARRRMDATTKRGHPYQVFIPNPAPGRFFGLSDVTLARKEQDALNQALTDDYELRVASYPFYAVLAGLISPEDLDKIRRREPNAIVELTTKADDIQKALKKFDGEKYDPNLTLPAARESQRAIEMLLGLPTEAMQGTNSATRFATQSQIQSDNLSAQMGRIVRMITELQRQVYEDWTDFALACMSQDEVRAIAGPFAEWPAFDRDQIARGMTVEVVAAGTRANRRGDLEDLTNAMQVAKGMLEARALALQQGMEFPVEDFAKRLTASLDLRTTGPMIKAIPPQVIQQAQMAQQEQAQAQIAAAQPPGAPQAGPVAA